jgi:hypothetical protein
MRAMELDEPLLSNAESVNRARLRRSSHCRSVSVDDIPSVRGATMKAKLIFDLPEETEEFELASHAGSYASAIEDFTAHLRALYKSDQETVNIEELRKAWFDNLAEHRIEG